MLPVVLLLPRILDQLARRAQHRDNHLRRVPQLSPRLVMPVRVMLPAPGARGANVAEVGERLLRVVRGPQRLTRSRQGGAEKEPVREAPPVAELELLSEPAVLP